MFVLLQTARRVRAFLKQTPKPDVVAYEKMLNEVVARRKAVEDISYSTENLGLLQVDCTALRKRLLDNLNTTKDLLLAALSEEMSKAAESIIDQYVAIERQLEKRPTNENELEQAQVFVLATQPLDERGEDMVRDFFPYNILRYD